jgi:hypothetical protein
MPITEVLSPVSRKGSKVGSNPPLSPGARSDPGRATTDRVPAQPSHETTSRHSEEPAASLQVTGPPED